MRVKLLGILYFQIDLKQNLSEFLFLIPVRGDKQTVNRIKYEQWRDNEVSLLLIRKVNNMNFELGRKRSAREDGL